MDEYWFGGMTQESLELQRRIERILCGICGGDIGGIGRICDRDRNVGIDRVAFDGLRNNRPSSHVQAG